MRLQRANPPNRPASIARSVAQCSFLFACCAQPSCHFCVSCSFLLSSFPHLFPVSSFVNVQRLVDPPLPLPHFSLSSFSLLFALSFFLFPFCFSFFLFSFSFAPSFFLCSFLFPFPSFLVSVPRIMTYPPLLPIRTKRGKKNSVNFLSDLVRLALALFPLSPSSFPLLLLSFLHISPPPSLCRSCFLANGRRFVQ